MKKHFIPILSCVFALCAMIMMSACSTDDFAQNPDPDPVVPEPEKKDTTSTDTTHVEPTPTPTPVVDNYDKVPAEHSIEYEITETKQYSYLGFYNHYLQKAQSIIGTLSGLSASGKATTTSSSSSVTSLTGFDFKSVIEQLFKLFTLQANVLLGTYHTATITYSTTDIDNNPIKASALLIWHNNGTINKVIYANHFTRVGDLEDVTNGFPLEILFASTGALIIVPDYIGAGVLKDVTEPYLVAQVSGDVAVDSYLAGIKFAKENISNFSSSFSGYIEGYSQGGQVSLAALRSLQQRSAERQAMLNVKRVICGDGPYDLGATFTNYLEQSSMSMPVLLPMAINGMFAGYPNLVQNINFDSCFTDYALETGVPQAIKALTATSSLLTGFPTNIPASKVLASDLINKTGTTYNTLISLLKRQSLCSGWQPKYPLLFIHDKGDTVVPYVNMENAIAGLKNDYVEDPIILYKGMDHTGGVIYMFTNIINGTLLK